MKGDKPFIKLTANIPVADMDFVDEQVSKGNFASRTDAAREAIRCLKRDITGMKTNKKNGVKQAFEMSRPPLQPVAEAQS